MKLALCHYSYHRRWNAESWDVDRLADEVKALDIPGIDFHAGLLGARDGVADKIAAALARTHLELSGFSLSTNFNLDDDAKREAHIAETAAWLEVAASLNAPVCRIFGGHVDRGDDRTVETGLKRVVDSLAALAPKAADLGLVLALENHGGLPCTGQEQVSVIEQVNSPALRATVDVGNYMQGNQSPTDGTTTAAGHAAYVHVKDNKRTDPAGPWNQFAACTLGQGDVDIPACLDILAAGGYDGYVALEYEGAEDETTGVPESIRYMKSIM